MTRPLVNVSKGVIVVADDDRVLLTMLSEFLRAKGFRVFTAFDAMQAMVGVRQHKPKAVLLDIAMPGGGGIDVLKKLKTMNTTLQIPVIILTGSTDPTMRDKANELGADLFLTKPPDLPALHDALLQLIGLSPDPPEPGPA